MILALLTSAAIAGGGGIYLETLGGAATTDSTGFVARGGGGGMALGWYDGTYRSSFRYGRYWRVGAVGTTTEVRALDQLVESKMMIGMQLGRGVDLMNLGGWWTLSAGWAHISQATSLRDFLQEEHEFSEGVDGIFIRAALGGSYNFSHSVAFNFRYEPGVVWGANGFSLQGGIGIGLQFRIPVYRTNWRDQSSPEQWALEPVVLTPQPAVVAPVSTSPTPPEVTPPEVTPPEESAE